jgi:hypothetical protein
MANLHGHEVLRTPVRHWTLIPDKINMVASQRFRG